MSNFGKTHLPSFKVQIVSDTVGTICKQVQIMNQDAWKEFQELVQRGANLWPDASPEMKAFADLVTSGEVRQNYANQTTANSTANSTVKGT